MIGAVLEGKGAVKVKRDVDMPMCEASFFVVGACLSLTVGVLWDVREVCVTVVPVTWPVVVPDAGIVLTAGVGLEAELVRGFFCCLS